MRNRSPTGRQIGGVDVDKAFAPGLPGLEEAPGAERLRFLNGTNGGRTDSPTLRLAPGQAVANLDSPGVMGRSPCLTGKWEC
ncbi:hypothetical protein [Streptomyces sp. NPDC005408]|uniref:hypothetical protein n=1 Tax=Streptomyces sp. NPDC005408 TaxID=3155341 RepID=UPI0033BB3003